jgi:hypothetical protein
VALGAHGIFTTLIEDSSQQAAENALAIAVQIDLLFVFLFYFLEIRIHDIVIRRTRAGR